MAGAITENGVKLPGPVGVMTEKVTLLGIAATLWVMGLMILYENRGEGFGSDNLFALLLLGLGLVFFFVREYFVIVLKRKVPEFNVAEITTIHAYIKRYAGHSKRMLSGLADVADDPATKEKLKKMADLAAEIEE